MAIKYGGKFMDSFLKGNILLDNFVLTSQYGNNANLSYSCCALLVDEGHEAHLLCSLELRFILSSYIES